MTFLPKRDYVTFGSLLSQIRLSSVVRNVRAPYSGVETFCNISLPFCTLAILWPPCNILLRSSAGNPSIGGVKRKRGSKIERWWTYRSGYISYLIPMSHLGLSSPGEFLVQILASLSVKSDEGLKWAKYSYRFCANHDSGPSRRVETPKLPVASPLPTWRKFYHHIKQSQAQT